MGHYCLVCRLIWSCPCVCCKMNLRERVLELPLDCLLVEYERLADEDRYRVAGLIYEVVNRIVTDVQEGSELRPFNDCMREVAPSNKPTESFIQGVFVNCFFEVSS